MTDDDDYNVDIDDDDDDSDDDDDDDVDVDDDDNDDDDIDEDDDVDDDYDLNVFSWSLFRLVRYGNPDEPIRLKYFKYVRDKVKKCILFSSKTLW